MITIIRKYFDAVRGLHEALDGDDDPEIVGYAGESSTPAANVAPRPLGTTPRPDPILVAARSPAIDDWLDEIGAAWAFRGVQDKRISPAEFCRLPKVPGDVYAIPPRRVWPLTAYFLRDVWTPLRDVCGPMSVRGYRPPQYNAAVGGSKRSDHLWACALDLRPADGQGVTVIKREATKLYIKRGADLKMGLGVYSGNVHVSAGIRRRHWRDAGKWIKRVKRGE